MEARRERVSSFAEKDKENNACERNQHILCNNTDHGNVLVMLPLMETKPSTSIEYLENREKINDDSSTHSVTNKNFDNDDDKENTEKRRILSGSKIVNNNLEQDKIFSQTWTPVGRSPTCKSTDIKTLLRIDGGELPNTETARAKRKIPRPANAFMLFANEWRRKLAAQNPRESNKDISVRLGIFWKNMSKERKEKYFALAREVDKEHKRKYPGNVTSLALHDLIYKDLTHRQSFPENDACALRRYVTS